MDKMTAEAIVPVMIRSGFRDLPVEGHFTYTAEDPFAVRMRIVHEGVQYADWHFARDLLAEGLNRPAGTFMIEIQPADDGNEREQVYIVLRGPDTKGRMRESLFVCPTEALTRFLGRTYGVVVPGCEELDIDSGLLMLLTQG